MPKNDLGSPFGIEVEDARDSEDRGEVALVYQFAVTRYLHVAGPEVVVDQRVIADVMASAESHQIVDETSVELLVWGGQVPADPFLAPVVVPRPAVMGEE